MLSDTDNATLTRTGPGTLMGNLFRRFWMPALLPSELAGPDCPPIRFRILGEDLIAFRTTEGRPAFIANACPHRGASMFFGRNEENGLCCVYHGWKFDAEGNCIDMPSEPAESNFRNKVGTQSYPAAEWGGLVWIYMGPKEKQPELPEYEWCLQGENPDLTVYKWLQDSNYAQGLEGNIDTAHAGILHRRLNTTGLGGTDPDAAPTLQIRETDFGFYYGGRRDMPEGGYYWRVTPFVLPTFTSIPGPDWRGSGILLVPSDDEHCWWFSVFPEGRRFNPPTVEYVELIPGTWNQTRSRGNDYGIDREKQRTYNYTGIDGNRAQDAAVTESMGQIYDRSKEHLGTTDRAIIFWRRQMIRLAEQLAEGKEPPLATDAGLHRVRPINAFTTERDLEPLWEADHAEHLRTAPLFVEVTA